MSKQLDPLGTTAPELHLKGSIIIMGDSWALGEWYQGKVTHRGLEQYLNDHGYDVINLGIPAGSNCRAVASLQSHLLGHGSDNLVGIFCFWTEWHRDFRAEPLYISDMIDTGRRPQYYPIACYDGQIVHRLSHRIFQELQKCARGAKVPIGLIGGCSDVINVGDHYPGLYTVCESMTNLCLHDDPTTADPVFLIRPDDFWLHARSKKFFDSAELEFLLKDLERGTERLATWEQHREKYFSDGIHGNRNAHKKLFDFMVSNKIV